MSLLLAVVIFAIIIRWYESDRYFWLLAWPGTITHEFLHYVVALVTFGQPSKFTVIPVFEQDRVILGSVECDNLTWFNRLPIAVAPLLALPLALIAIGSFTFSWSWQGLLTTWLISSVVALAMPSGQDWRVGLSSPVGVAAWAGVVYIAIR